MQPRVRFAAIECLGTFSETYSGVFQKMYNRSVVPALIGVLGDATACDNVKGQAAASLVEFASPDHCTAKCMEPHLQACLASLFNVLATPAGGAVAALRGRPTFPESRHTRVQTVDFRRSVLGICIFSY